MASPNLIAKVLAWARSAEEASGVPQSAKYFYDASKALNGGKAAVLTDAETERLMRAVQSGHNTIVQRLGVPARDEQHLLAMRDDWLRLPPESKGFHVDLTPGGPAALMRQDNLRIRNLDPRPLSVAVRKPVNATDAQANMDGFLKKARRDGNDTIIYTPTMGELAPGSDAGNVYNSIAAEDFMLSHEKAAPGVWQPSAAILKPENVRDLFEAEFKNPKATGLGYAAGGAVKPTHNQDQMTHKRSSSQDQSTQPLTGSALQALVRGWIAGTAGLPGDLEGLGRAGLNALGAGVDKHTALPTTDYFKETLPGKQVGDENVATLGSLFGGAGMGTIAKGTNKAARAVPGALTQMARNAAVPRTLSPQAGVIKAPGGNWLAGSVEDALKGLRNNRFEEAEYNAFIRDQAEQGSGFRDWLGAKLEKTPEYQRKPGFDVMNEFLIEQGKTPAVTPPLNQFIDKQLTRYVKNDMATERDPIRALAERGTLHYDPAEVTSRSVKVPRMIADMPPEGLAQSPMARRWEEASDVSLFQNRAADYMLPGPSSTRESVREANPWIAKVPSETRVYGAGKHIEGLGFDHLMDELRNALNPASGLPRELQLDPKSLDRLSVPQAVERVAKINAWREAQKIEASQALANNPATHLFKEYPHSDATPNPKGLRWVELKSSEALPEGWKQKANGDFVMPDGRVTSTGPQERDLSAALKYEGDTMGHCVGGYCDDVASGKSRIFSLRDAKGQPHVTVEVAPGKAPRLDGGFDELPEDAVAAARAAMPRGDFQHGPLVRKWIANNWTGELVAKPDTILQIKGKGNKKPNDEYLPFVQDFVKSGKWSDVGDLQNTGLIHADSAIPWPASYGIEDVDKVKSGLGGYSLRKHLEEIDSKYTTPEAFHSWLGTKGYAKGGSVTADCGCEPKGYAAGGGVYAIDGPDGGTYGTPDEQRTTAPLPTLEQYKAKITAEMLDGQGKFLGPKAGVNYMLEGLTPEEAYNSAQGLVTQGDWSDDNRLGKPAARQQAEALLDPAWRAGPNNGGGFLGGVTRAVGGLAKGVMSNPALSMALTAGLAPMVSSGLQSAGMSAGMAKTATPLVSNAIKTVAGGGSLADAAKNAGIGYLGGQAGQLAEGATGMDFAGKVASSVTQSALRGKPLSIDALATQYATGKLTDLSGLDPSVVSIVVNLAKRKRPSATGALSALAKYSRL